MTFHLSGGSHRRAVHSGATPRVWAALATIVLSLLVVGLIVKASVPDLVYDDLTYLIAAGTGGATADSADDDGNSPLRNESTCKLGDFAKAMLVTVGFALLHSLTPVHTLTVSAVVVEPLLSDFLLPNAETGPPAGTVPVVTPRVPFLATADVPICAFRLEQSTNLASLD